MILLSDCKTVEDLKNWGLEYMSKRDFMPLKIEIEDKWMKFFGMTVKENDKDMKVGDKNEEGHILIAETTVNKKVDYEMCAFKKDITKYVKGFVPKKDGEESKEAQIWKQVEGLKDEAKKLKKEQMRKTSARKLPTINQKSFDGGNIEVA